MKYFVFFFSFMFILSSLSSETVNARFDPRDFVSLGNLNLSAGNIVFNTDTLQISGSFTGMGVLSQTQSNTQVAIFTFDDIALLNGVSVSFTGSRAIALLSKNNVTIGTTLDISGAKGFEGEPANSPTPGRLGGYAGGAAQTQTTTLLNGIGRGYLGVLTNFEAGGGGGYGGIGGTGASYFNRGASLAYGGTTYGSSSLLDLLGGSGGAGSAGLSGGNIQPSSGGAGGGAIEIAAWNQITIQSTGQIVSKGGDGGDYNTGGGGGSGGAILLTAGTSLINQGVISVVGGNGGPLDGTTVGGGGGGGGRVALYYGTGLTTGNILTTGGYGKISANGGGDGANGGNGTLYSQSFYFSQASIPEPSTCILFLASAAFLVLINYSMRL